ncbi:MAG: acyl-CoA dehydrogenase family protein [Polyangiales bacterium]
MRFAESRDDDLAPLLLEVDRFAEGVIRPRAARPELPMDAVALSTVLEEADALGLAGADEAPIGLGLWEDLEDPRGPTRTVTVLVRLGRENPAVGLALHQRGLGRELVRALGLVGHGHGPVLALPWGSIGVGRDALAALLAGAELPDDASALLAAEYDPYGARIVTMPQRFGALLVPWVDRTGTVGFDLHRRSGLRVDEAPQPHGFDELVTCRVAPTAPPEHRAIGGKAAEVFASMLRAESLARVALALGALERAHELAKTYAATRTQGGSTIDRHDAVRLLLARGRSVRSTVAASLAAAAAQRPSAEATIGTFAMRAEAHPAIAAATNDALQVFGGLGYMRDTGLEKIVRDTNHLRVVGGSPRELSLVVAEWERLHA